MFNKYLSGNVHPAITFIAAWLLPQLVMAVVAWNATTLLRNGVVANVNFELLNTIMLGVMLLMTALLTFPYWRSIQSNTRFKWLGWLGLAFLGMVLAVGGFGFVTFYVSL